MCYVVLHPKLVERNKVSSSLENTAKGEIKPSVAAVGPPVCKVYRAHSRIDSHSDVNPVAEVVCVNIIGTNMACVVAGHCINTASELLRKLC